MLPAWVRRPLRRRVSSVSNAVRSVVETLESRQFFAATLPAGFSESLFVNGLNHPTDQAFLPDGRILVTEKGGTLRVVKNGTVLSTPALTLNVETVGDRGLNAVEMDPNFATNRYIYVVYMPLDPAKPNNPPNASMGRLSRFTMSATGDTVVAGSEVILLNDIPNQTGFHMGGFLGFGADGMLYIGTGDGAATTDSLNSGITVYSQDVSRLDGKILRIDVRNPAAGIIPADNPYVNTPGARGEVWAVGFRNAFSGAFVPTTSDLYINDVSQDLIEEINHVAKGANYGWNTYEGPVNIPGFTDPVYSYTHDGLRSSPTGAFFYNDNVFPGIYKGKYFFGDYSRNFIKVLDVNTGTVQDFATNTASGVVRLDPTGDGGFYYLSYDVGQIWKVSYTGSANRAPAPTAEASRTSGPTGMSVGFDATGSEDPDGDPLTYLWNFGDGSTASGLTASHVYTTAGVYNATLVASDNRGLSTTTLPIQITVGNNAPVVTITTPLSSLQYVAGQTLNFSGTAIDQEDGVLPAANYSWEIDFYHKGHFSDFMTSLPGVTSGSVQLLTSGDTALDQFYRIKLTVTDLAGLSYTTFTDIKPRISTVTIASNVPGVTVGMDLLTYTAGVNLQAVAGMARTIVAPPTQVINGVTYAFSGWSDGGAASHNVNIPSNDIVYTAIYKDTSGTEASGLLGTYYNTADLTGPAILTRVDSTVNFDWGTSTAGTGLNADNFSVRWTGTVTPSFSQRYTFYTTSDDGVRLWVNNQLIIDNWTDHSTTENNGSIQLVAGQKYAIRMEYYEKGGGAVAKLFWSSSSTPKAAIPLTALLSGAARPVTAGPTGLVATAAANGASVALAWTDNSNNESGFKIERKGPGDADYVQIAVTAAGATSYTDSTVAKGATYAYRVRGSNGAGDSIYSYVATATTPATTPAPGSLTATAQSTTSIKLTWTDLATNETGYRIDRSTDGSTFTLLTTAAANATSYTDTGLTASTLYYYRVTTVAPTGNVTSTTVSATTFAPAPATPTNVVATATSYSTATVTWTDASNNETGFRVEQLSGTGQWFTVSTVGAGVTTANVANLMASTAYSFRIIALGASTDSAASTVATTTTPAQPQPVPTAPQNVTATAASSTSIAVTYDNPLNATGYIIERSTNGTTFAQVATMIWTSNAYTDTGLSPSTTYYYRVIATGIAQNSPPSAVVSATTQAPASLTTLRVNAGGGTFVDGSGKTWSADTGFTAGTTSATALSISNTTDDELYYDRRYAQNFSFAAPVVNGNYVLNLYFAEPAYNAVGKRVFSVSAENTALLTNFDIVKDAGAYKKALVKSFNVSVTDGQIDLNFVSTIENAIVSAIELTPAPAPTAPAAPTGLSAVPASTSQVNLAWTDKSSNETVFVIERKGPGETSFSVVGQTNANVTTYADTGLTTGATYVYRVKAINAIGGSDYTNESSATPVAQPVADIILDNNSSTGVTVSGSWGQSSYDKGFEGTNYLQDGATGKGSKSVTYAPNINVAGTYRVYVKYPQNNNRATNVRYEITDATGTVTTVLVNQRVNGGQWNALGVFNFAVGTTGKLVIRTTGTTGYVVADAARFEKVDGSTPTAPTAPVNVAAVAQGATAVKVTWTDAPDESSYVIERSTTIGGPWTQVGTAAANAVQFVDTTASADTTYFYRVISLNLGLSSTPSNVATVTTDSASAFSSVDIGSPAVSGSTVWNGPTTATLAAGGTDVYGTSDQLQFAYKQYTGNFDIKVRVSALNAADAWTKAGLMARDGLTSGAKNAFILASPTTHRFTYRTSANGSTSLTGSGTATYPNVWVRLSRVGNLFTGYVSVDGANWTVVGSKTITMATTVYAGLALTSHNAGSISTATFDNFAG